MDSSLPNNLQRLKDLMGKDLENNISDIVRLFGILVQEGSGSVDPFLIQSATRILSPDVVQLLKKHRIEAHSYKLVVNNLLDLEDLKDDLLNGDILSKTVPANAIRKLKTDLSLQAPSTGGGNARVGGASSSSYSSSRLAHRVAGECHTTRYENEMTLHILPLTQSKPIGSSEVTSIMKRFQVGPPCPMEMPRKTILLMGATGSGKTTMINAIINYLFGVEWDDPFRFLLIDEQIRGSQANSQTRDVIAYDINHREGLKIPYSLTIVDTPGFGDTEGIERDEEITSAVKKFFEHKNGIQEIDTVGFVVQSPLARLTYSQLYIFNSVLNIFGKDIGENVRFLITFDDGGEPLVLNAIKEAKLPCLVDANNLPSHQRFNNRAIFLHNNQEDYLSAAQWKEGMKSFQSFFNQLKKMPTKSLQLTKEVLNDRESLNTIITTLKASIDRHLVKMEELRIINEELSRHQSELECNKDFEITVTVTKKVKDTVEEDTALNCSNCETTCHYPCNPSLPIEFCPAFWRVTNLFAFTQSNFSCKFCPGNCGSSSHQNEDEMWTYKQVEEKKTLYDVRKKYDEANRKLLTGQELKNELLSEIEQLKYDMADLVKKVVYYTNQLRKNALRGDPITALEYLKQMVETEKSEKRPGYKQKIKHLEDMIGNAGLLKDIVEGDGKSIPNVST